MEKVRAPKDSRCATVVQFFVTNFQQSPYFSKPPPQRGVPVAAGAASKRRVYVTAPMLHRAARSCCAGWGSPKSVKNAGFCPKYIEQILIA